MGQGSESCGGYDCDAEYDYLENCQERGVWPQKVGAPIHISEMTGGHLKNSISHVEKLAKASTFECNRQMWETWIDMFEQELARRRLNRKSCIGNHQKNTSTVRGVTQAMRCHCGEHYVARTADIKRGWGLSCSKRCAAIRRDFGRPAAVTVNP